MPQDNKAFLPPIDEELRDQFRQDVRDRYGGIRGHYGTATENAIREYLDASIEGGDLADELRRLQDEISELRDAVSGETGSETDSVSKTTENRIHDIMQDIQRRSDELGTARVRESDVEAAIERHAGTSYKTIQRYKQLLVNQRKLFPHPDNKEVYFTTPKSFIVFMEHGDGERWRDAVRGEYGDEWWKRHAPNSVLESVERSGFQ